MLGVNHKPVSEDSSVRIWLETQGTFEVDIKKKGGTIYCHIRVLSI